jgi:hypothetical protein
LTVLFIAGIVFLMVVFPKLRCIVFNPVKVIFYLPKDIYLYFKRRKYNDCPIGIIVAIVALFGKGKTLTAVHIVADFYRRKDGKKVWCKRRKKMVTQRVKIISNVELIGIPYERFLSLEQVVYASKNNTLQDDINNELTITLVLGDEFSAQMNSRSFKSNINTMLLNTILTCRHYHIAMYYTTQRFGLVDALLRQVTSYVINCDKTWRLQGIDYYDAWEMENATNVLQLKAYKRSCWFVRDKDYNRYDTLAVVENLQRCSENGDMITDEQVLALQCNNPDLDNIMKPSRKFKRIRKTMK